VNCQRHRRQPRRHALERSIAAREDVQRQEDQQVEQPELGHRSSDGAEKDADRSREKQIDCDTEQEQRDRPGDRDAEQPLQDEIKRQADCDDDDETVGPDLGHCDLERGQRHDQEMVHRAVFSLANDGGASEDDRQHRDAVDDAHDAGKPAHIGIGVESDAHYEIDRRQRCALSP